MEWPEFCPEPCHCSCFFDKDHGSQIKVRLNCSNNDLTSIPNFSGVPHFSIEQIGQLDLSSNRLKYVSSLEHILTDNLISLNLENNEFDSIGLVSPKHLRELKLAGNWLESLPLSTLSNLSLSIITLANNSWICDCKTTVPFKEWLLSNNEIVKDVYEVKCGSNGPHPSLYGRVIVSLKDTELCPIPINIYVVTSVGILSFLLLAAFMVIACSRYRLYIKVWLYSHGFSFVKDDEEDTEKEFDALVSYHSSDEEFVLNEIVPRLEK